MSETVDYPHPKNKTPAVFDFDGKGAVPAHRHRNPDGTAGGFVAYTAFVDDTVHVARGALVYGNAQVLEMARVVDRARVCGSAVVGGHAQLQGSSVVSGAALVSDFAIVRGMAKVFGEARVKGNALVGGETLVGVTALLRKRKDLMHGSSGEVNWSAYWYLPADKTQKRVWLTYGTKVGDLDDYWPTADQTYLSRLVVSFVRRAFYPTSDLEYLARAVQDTGETPP